MRVCIRALGNEHQFVKAKARWERVTSRGSLYSETLTTHFRQVIAQYPDLLEPNLRKPFHDGGLWLVRPDGYVAMAANGTAGTRLPATSVTLRGRAGVLGKPVAGV